MTHIRHVIIGAEKWSVKYTRVDETVEAMSDMMKYFSLLTLSPVFAQTWTYMDSTFTYYSYTLPWLIYISYPQTNFPVFA